MKSAYPAFDREKRRNRHGEPLFQTLREQLSTPHSRRHLRPEKKPRGSRFPQESVRLNSPWSMPTWRLNGIIDLLGQANSRLMSPLHPVLPWNATFWQADTKISNGDEGHDLCFLAGKASFAYNPFFIPSLSPLISIASQETYHAHAGSSLPTGIEFSTRLETLHEPESFIAVDISTLAWAYPWGIASFFHRYREGYGVGIFASTPLTDSFKGLTEAENTVLSEEVVVGARFASETRDAGVQLEVVDRLFGCWWMARQGPWLSGIQARFPVDRIGVEDISAKLFYAIYVKDDGSKKGLAPVLTSNSGQRIAREAGIQLLDNGRIFKASCFHHFDPLHLGSLNLFGNGIDMGVEVIISPFIKSPFKAFNLSSYWQASNDLGISVYSGLERCGIAFSPIWRLGETSLLLNVAFNYSFRSGGASVRWIIDFVMVIIEFNAIQLIFGMNA